MSALGSDHYYAWRSLATLVRALNTKSMALLEPGLAPNYMVGNLTGEAAKEALKQVVANYPRSICCISVRKKSRLPDDSLDFEVLLHCSDGPRMNRFFYEPGGPILRT